MIRLVVLCLGLVFAAPPAFAQFAARPSAFPPADIELLDSAGAAHLEGVREKQGV